MTQTFLCACKTCAHHCEGLCRAAGVLFESSGACATFAKKSALEEYARELAPQAGQVRCAKRACVYNDAMRCRAEKIDVQPDDRARCASFFAPQTNLER